MLLLSLVISVWWHLVCCIIFLYILRFVTYLCIEISSLIHVDSQPLPAIPIWEADVYICKTCYSLQKAGLSKLSLVCNRILLTTIVYGIMTTICSVPLGSVHNNAKYVSQIMYIYLPVTYICDQITLTDRGRNYLHHPVLTSGEVRQASYSNGYRWTISKETKRQ